MINSSFTGFYPYRQEIFPGWQGTGGIFGKGTGRIKGLVKIYGYLSPLIRLVQVQETSSSIRFQCTRLICKNDKKPFTCRHRIKFLLHTFDTETKDPWAHVFFHRTDDGWDE